MVNEEELTNSYSQQPKQRKGFFSEPKEDVGRLSTLSSDVNLLSRRVRVIEDRYNNLRRKAQVDEQNMLNLNKRFSMEIKTLNDDFNELKSELSDLKNKIIQIIDELKKGAKKEEFKVLQKYVEMWEPLRFVTRNEVEKLINEAIEKRMS